MSSSTSTAEDVLESLTRVIDPEYGINIVDLGLVYGVEVEPDSATIQMTMTSLESPSRTSIEGDIRTILARRHPELRDVVVDLVWEPEWRDDFITDDGRRQLYAPIVPAASASDPVTESSVLDSLMLVMDPEVGINVVDLGLVYDIAIDDTAVRVTMTLTTPGCPLHASIEAAVKRVLETRHPGLTDVEMDLVWTPPWDTDMITTAGRAQLGW